MFRRKVERGNNKKMSRNNLIESTSGFKKAISKAKNILADVQFNLKVFEYQKLKHPEKSNSTTQITILKSVLDHINEIELSVIQMRDSIQNPSQVFDKTFNHSTGESSAALNLTKENNKSSFEKEEKGDTDIYGTNIDKIQKEKSQENSIDIN